jgi:PPE-repeat protein
MDFGAPPEITSALIHSGPGAGSLLAAANAWRQLATDLEQTAAHFVGTMTADYPATLIPMRMLSGARELA